MSFGLDGRVAGNFTSLRCIFRRKVPLHVLHKMSMDKKMVISIILNILIVFVSQNIQIDAFISKETCIIPRNGSIFSDMQCQIKANVEKIAHVPHAHYNMSVDEYGIPTNPDKEYYMSDFESVFHVRPIFNYVHTKKAKHLLSKLNLFEHEEFIDFEEEIIEKTPQLSAYINNLTTIDMREVAVKWVSKQIGFGVVAKRSFKEGDIVGIYTGVVFASDKYDTFNTDYMWELPNYHPNMPKNTEFYVDARVAGNYLRFVNHATEPNTDTFFFPYYGKWYLFYLANKDIQVNEWITVHYGNYYFKTRPQF